MASNKQISPFEAVPNSWFEPVVGLWVTLFAVLGVNLTFAGARQLLYPPEPVSWVAPFATTFVAVFGYGVFAFGLTHIYRTARDFKPQLTLEPPDSEEWRWIGGLGVAALLVMGLGGVWATLVGYPTTIAAPLITIGEPPLFDGFPVGLGLAGVNGLVNVAPSVVFMAMLGGVLLGPAVGVLFHGLLQDTLARAGPPGSAIAGTAVVTTVLLENSAFISMTTFHEALSTVAVFGFVVGVAYAYRKTENLLVVMAAYGLFNVLAVVLAWISIVMTLYANGHLVA